MVLHFDIAFKFSITKAVKMDEAFSRGNTSISCNNIYTELIFRAFKCSKSAN